MLKRRRWRAATRHGNEQALRHYSHLAQRSSHRLALSSGWPVAGIKRYGTAMIHFAAVQKQ
jgi:hypothetical protein